ncbi:MAG: PilZ domain-containing protein [Proteobacteria bacterium]|nr:PilZ domain-containing protein [Pseudomonadota bacterium]MBU1739625.1 PilZ domain-containing protein [Pseudomonadota bacterium]
MKEHWSADSQVIHKTFTTLIKGNHPFYIYQLGRDHFTVYAREIFNKNGNTLVMLFKPDGNCINREKCFITFQLPGEPICGFDCEPVLETAEHIAINLPQEIFKVQRRKHSRVNTPGNSRAIFAFRDRKRLVNCRVEDFSLIGARLISDSYEDTRKGEVLEPVSLSLYAFENSREQQINIPEARVARTRDLPRNRTEIGISFAIPPSDLDLLDAVEIYLKMRRKEAHRESSPATKNTV